jgi:hypothetical protein
MKNLLKKVRQRDDSPIRSKLADIQQQWQQRKHRIEIFMATPPTEPANPVACTIVHDPVLQLTEELIFDNEGSENRILSEVTENQKSTDECVSQEI